jgi:hypothetical protein
MNVLVCGVIAAEKKGSKAHERLFFSPKDRASLMGLALRGGDDRTYISRSARLCFHKASVMGLLCRPGSSEDTVDKFAVVFETGKRQRWRINRGMSRRR